MFEIIRRFILEGESWDEAWRRWGYGAVDLLIFPTTQKKAASQKDSSSSEDAEWNSYTEPNLLSPRQSVVAR
jgi:hypothetical protein